jgi:hypothetical protein
MFWCMEWSMADSVRSFILYDNFKSQIESIYNHFDQVTESAHASPGFVPRKMRNRDGNPNISAVVEVALLQLLEDAASLSRTDWMQYIERYENARKTPGIQEKRKTDKRHVGEASIIYSEIALDAIDKIVKAMLDRGVLRRKIYRLENINRKLVVAVAILHTSDNLPQ